MTDDLYWRFSLYELVAKLNNKIGFEASIIMSNHAAMVHIANGIFGDGKDRPPENGKDVTEGAHSFDQAVANMNALLNWG